MLEALGLTEAAVTLYRALLRQPEITVGELTRSTSLAAPKVRVTLGQLIDAGLVSGQPGRPARYTAIAPGPALQTLLLRRTQDLERARDEIGHLQKEFPGTPSGPVVEVIHDPKLALRRYVEMQLNAKRDIRLFDAPPYVLRRVDRARAEQFDAERELLARGVSYRVLYGQASFERPDQPERSRSFLRAGQEGRLAPDIPFKAMIVDGQHAIVLEGSEPTDPGMVVLRQSPLVQALVMVFDSLWERGVPLPSGDVLEADDSDNQQVDTRLLTLLAAGIKDEAVAKQLDISVRTVRRRVARLLQQLGAHSRFQAGILARERGLL